MGLDFMNVAEHRDLLKRARAHRAARANDDDFRSFTEREEYLGGLR